MGTVVVLAIVILIAAWAVRSIYKDKKSGKACAGCAGCCGSCCTDSHEPAAACQCGSAEKSERI